MAGPHSLAPGANRLLADLPPASRERLQAIGRSVHLKFGQVLIGQEEPIQQVYFPTSGVVSLVVLMQDGRGVDAAVVGCEGMVGAPLVLGIDVTPWEATVQVAGEALQVPAAAFRQVMERDEALRELLLRFVGALLVQAARSAACNQLHEVTARLARFLLQVHDTVGKDDFRITQDLLAAMLGVRRATVSTGAGALQQAGLITYSRGTIIILDRRGLEEAACEDYFAVRDAFEHLPTLSSPRAATAT
jgi:CRP-like cAMP-binding protein